MDIASSLAMQPADGAGLRPLNLDGIRRAAPQSHKWAVKGTPDSVYDQAVFYSLRGVALESTDHEAATITGPNGWDEDEMARYIADNPAPLRNLHFTRASSDGLLEGTTIRFVRETPDRSLQEETIELSTFVHDKRYQPRVLSIPINGEVLDGYTSLVVINPGEGDGAATPGSEASYTMTASFGSANDKRADAPPARAAIITEPK